MTLSPSYVENDLSPECSSHVHYPTYPCATYDDFSGWTANGYYASDSGYDQPNCSYDLRDSHPHMYANQDSQLALWNNVLDVSEYADRYAYDEQLAYTPSIADFRSDMGTPSSICSPPVLTPVPQFPNHPAIAVMPEDPDIYQVFMENINRCAPEGKTVLNQSEHIGSGSKAVHSVLTPRSSNTLDMAPNDFHNHSQDTHRFDPAIFASSFPASSNSDSNYPQLETPKFLSLSQLEYIQGPSRIAMTVPASPRALPLHAPRPKRPIPLLGKPAIDLTSLANSGAPVLVQTVDNLSVGQAFDDASGSAETFIDTGFQGSQDMTPGDFGEDDDLDADGEFELDEDGDESEEFRVEYDLTREADTSTGLSSLSTPNYPESSVPLLCQAVPDELRYQAPDPDFSHLWAELGLTFSGTAPRGLTRSRQVCDEEDLFHELQLGSPCKRRRVGC